MRLTILLIWGLVISFSPLQSQTWVDTLYQITTIENIPYGTATDFAGNERLLSMDISYPTNDVPPVCGRPLLVAIHGGAFISGNKSSDLPPLWRQHFAKRGYTTASISYRLGQFPTHLSIHCNISNFDVEWDCLNMADTSEWYRAYYRAVQDAHGAIRFLVNHATEYNIDPDQIYVVGESAGAFIAMGVGFIDQESDILAALIDTMPPVQSPNHIYEGPCVQGYDYDTTIQSMNLERPALGHFEGYLNAPANQDYTIQGVGAFYGGVFNNIFINDEPETSPLLYLFHQPADLIVPYNTNKVLAGFAYCATQFPAFCQYIINRPSVSGSNGIVSMLEAMEANGQHPPEFQFDHTNNNAGCAEQILNPGVQGHAVDNYWLRSQNMATFFATRIDCVVSDQDQSEATPIRLYPNPCQRGQAIYLELEKSINDLQIQIIDAKGRLITTQMALRHSAGKMVFHSENLKPGVYFLNAKEGTNLQVEKIVIF